MDSEFFYFGYGSKRSVEMMKAIIGRRPRGLYGYLKDHQLLVQTWNEIPENVRKILGRNWDENFKAYAARPSKGHNIGGICWSLTREVRSLVKNWEMVGLWYQPAKVKVRTSLVTVDAETEITNDAKLSRAVDGSTYHVFLNDK